MFESRGVFGGHGNGLEVFESRGVFGGQVGRLGVSGSHGGYALLATLFLNGRESTAIVVSRKPPAAMASAAVLLLILNFFRFLFNRCSDVVLPVVTKSYKIISKVYMNIQSCHNIFVANCTVSMFLD